MRVKVKLDRRRPLLEMGKIEIPNGGRAYKPLRKVPALMKLHELLLVDVKIETELLAVRSFAGPELRQQLSSNRSAP